MMMPALSTLLSNAPGERHSNASPVPSPILLYDSHQKLVFFFGPGSVCNVAKIAQLEIPLVALDLWLANDFADSAPCSFTQFFDQAEQLSVLKSVEYIYLLEVRVSKFVCWNNLCDWSNLPFHLWSRLFVWGRIYFFSIPHSDLSLYGYYETLCPRFAHHKQIFLQKLDWHRTTSSWVHAKLQQSTTCHDQGDLIYWQASHLLFYVGEYTVLGSIANFCFEPFQTHHR